MALDSTLLVPRVPNAGAVTLASGATLNSDMSQGSRFVVPALATNASLAIPTNPTDGLQARWEITATGGTRTVTAVTSATAGAFALTDKVATAAPAIPTGKTAVIEAFYSAAAARFILTNINIQA